MSNGSGKGSVAEFLHRYFLWLLIGAYLLAGFSPVPGRWISSVAGTGHLFGQGFRVSLPAAMLGVLLFAAGLAVKWTHLRDMFRRPATLAVGLCASIVAPVLVLIAVSPMLSFWHDAAEARDLIVGLAVVAAMPVAGSSAGWSRAADGDCALSLGLVLLSTVLSPFTTPLALGAVGALVPGDAGGVLNTLTGASGAGMFVVVWVVLPMALGLLTRWVVCGRRADSLGSPVKIVTSLILLVLCYSNASVCLPQVVSAPDWDFLVLIVAGAVAMCATTFVAGFTAARTVRADPARKAALVFGVGMANNGAGLALAAGALAACPMALLPVVAVNLVQHLAAGWANTRLNQTRTGVEAEQEPAQPLPDPDANAADERSEELEPVTSGS